MDRSLFCWAEMKKPTSEHTRYLIGLWSLHTYAYPGATFAQTQLPCIKYFVFVLFWRFRLSDFFFVYLGDLRLRCGCRCCWGFYCWTSFVYNFCLIAIGIIIIKTHTQTVSVRHVRRTKTKRNRFKTPAKKRQKRNRKNKYGNHKRWAKHQYYFFHMPTWEIKIPEEKKMQYFWAVVSVIFWFYLKICRIIQIIFVRKQSAIMIE